MASHKIKLPVTVDLTEARLELSSTLGYLDLDSLSKARRAEVLIGTVAGGCCDQKIHAAVRNGRVVDLRMEPCEENPGQPLSRDLQKLAAQLIRRARPRRPRVKLPLPVRDFFASAAQTRQVTVQVLVCVRICMFGACITCCRRTDIANGPLTCGRLTIDTTVAG